MIDQYASFFLKAACLEFRTKIEKQGKFSFKNLSLTIDWKHECNRTKKGDLFGKARTLRSVIAHSTSSSCKITSFFRIFTANSSSICFCSASITFNKSKDKLFYCP